LFLCNRAATKTWLNYVLALLWAASFSFLSYRTSQYVQNSDYYDEDGTATGYMAAGAAFGAFEFILWFCTAIYYTRRRSSSASIRPSTNGATSATAQQYPLTSTSNGASASAPPVPIQSDAGRLYEPSSPVSHAGRLYEPTSAASHTGRLYEPTSTASHTGRLYEPTSTASHTGRLYEPTSTASHTGRLYEPSVPPQAHTERRDVIYAE